MSMLNTKSIDALSSRLIELACEQINLPKDQVTLDSIFTDDLHFDSLDLAEFVMSVEEAFDISVPEEEIDKIKTVRDAIEAIRLLS